MYIVLEQADRLTGSDNCPNHDELIYLNRFQENIEDSKQLAMPHFSAIRHRLVDSMITLNREALRTIAYW